MLALPFVGLTNLAADAVLIGPMGMGVAGAAWATVLAINVNAVCLFALWRRKAAALAAAAADAAEAAASTAAEAAEAAARRVAPRMLVKPSRAELAALVGFAGPMMVALTARVSVGLSLTLTATAMGTMALASHQVVESLYWLFCPFGEAVSLCMQAYLPKMLMASRTPSLAARLQRTAFRAAALLALVAGASAAAIPLCFSGLFTSCTTCAGHMAAAAPLLGLALVSYVVSSAAEGMLIARRKLRFLAATHVANAAALFAALRTLVRGGGSLPQLWALVGLMNAARVVEFLCALHRAEASAAAEPAAVADEHADDHVRPWMWLRRKVRRWQRDRAPGAAVDDLAHDGAFSVPDIASEYPDLLAHPDDDTGAWATAEFDA
jgi:Na+-driven multidrug efflux pump